MIQKTCSSDIVIPTLDFDICQGETKPADCVIDSTAYPGLNLQENSSQKEINQALYQNALAQEPQVNSDWDAVEGPAVILNKPVIIDIATIGNLLQVFADNAAAIAGGLPINHLYKTPTGDLKVRV